MSRSVSDYKMMNPREEKTFESSIDQLIDYVKAIKESLQVFINKIDHESGRLDWNEVLDSFSSVCSQMNTLMRFSRKNKTIFSGNKVILPLMLSLETDEDLIKLTEARVPVVNHEMVPNYLRTKPDPEVEENELAVQTKLRPYINMDVSTKNRFIYTDAVNKLVNTFNKITTNIENYISSVKQQSWNDEKKPTYLKNETSDLISAISLGVGLRPGTAAVRSSGPDASYINRANLGPANNANVGGAKAPELKTNIINSNT